MNDELCKLDVACAQAMGWHVINAGVAPLCDVNGDPVEGGAEWVGANEEYKAWAWAWSPAKDHSDARLLEDEIERRDLRHMYITALFDVMDWTAELGDDESGDGAAISSLSIWMALRATPEQKCRAFLKVIESSNAHA